MAVLLVAAPLAGRIPLCALAAILFVVAWNMSGAAHCLRMIRTAPRADVVILLITFGLTMMTDLVIAVNIGVILAMLQFLRRMASSVEVVAQDAVALSVPLPEGVVVYAIEGPFFFGTVDCLELALAHTGTDPRCLVLRLGHVPFMDITGIQALQEAMASLERRGVRVMFCEANMRVLRKLLRAGLFPRGGPRRYCSTLAVALERVG